MSIFLSQDKMWDRALGGYKAADEAAGIKQIPHWFGNLAWIVVGFVCKVLFRYKVENREQLRAFKGRSGAVVICNHTSFLDVAFMYLAARPSQWLRLLGRDTLFGNAGGLLGQILSRVGAIPIKRDTSDRTAIKRATKALKRGELIGILPEGTRRGKGNLEPKLHAGAAFIAKMGGSTPLLPMAVRGVERIKPKGERVHFPRVKVIYGNPVEISDFDFLPKDERLMGCTWYVMRESFAMFYDCAPQDVDMVALFPETRDFSADFLAHPIARRTTNELLDARDAAAAAKLEAREAKADAASVQASEADAAAPSANNGEGEKA
jgi:1-acyl-sn-glycerol-3-phosphate acyltransferase